MNSTTAAETFSGRLRSWRITRAETTRSYQPSRRAVTVQGPCQLPVELGSAHERAGLTLGVALARAVPADDVLAPGQRLLEGVEIVHPEDHRRRPAVPSDHNPFVRALHLVHDLGQVRLHVRQRTHLHDQIG